MPVTRENWASFAEGAGGAGLVTFHGRAAAGGISRALAF
jgi:hypothetical protein